MTVSSPIGESAPPQRLAADADSFRVFYADALPRVYGYLLRRCGGSVAVAEDLTQDTFLAAVAELRKGRSIETPVPWVLGIARHKLLDHYRRQERAERIIHSAERELAERPGEGSELARDRTIAALVQVPAAQRAALVLRHLDGLSVPDVAHALGRSVESVESLLTRGRQSFRRAYQEVDA
jgi:RNA polymerase sigma-70 factor (ECF subfamily)